MPRRRFSLRCMASNVGATVTSLDVVKSILSSTLRSIPSAILQRIHQAVLCVQCVLFVLKWGGREKGQTIGVWWAREGAPLEIVAPRLPPCAASGDFVPVAQQL